jgi:hypothetical protein
MTHKYTQNNIIQFIYKECDLFERLEMEFALEDDSTFMESYQELLDGYTTLPKVSFSPKTSSVDVILAYSAKALT